jgi:hypothetical protein
MAESMIYARNIGEGIMMIKTEKKIKTGKNFWVAKN